MNAAGANRTAEGAEMRRAGADRPDSKQRRGAATETGGMLNCGKTAEALRKPPLPKSTSRSPSPSANKPAPSPDACTAIKPSPARPVSSAGRKAGDLRMSVADCSPLALVPSPASRRKIGAKVSPPARAKRASVGLAKMAPHELAVIEAALAIVQARMQAKGAVLDSPVLARQLAALHLGHLERECFGVMFLDSQHRLIEFAPMFYGSLTQTSVYPREVARLALALNAGAVILAHNHPSGLPEPSLADESLTKTLKSVLGGLDVRVLDHLVVGGTHCVSMAERGLI